MGGMDNKTSVGFAKDKILPLTVPDHFTKGAMTSFSRPVSAVSDDVLGVQAEVG